MGRVNIMAYTNRTTGNTVSKRRALAQAARRRGYFREGYKLWNRCPLCHRNVYGELYHGHTIVESLDVDMMAHLEDCIDALGPVQG